VGLGAEEWSGLRAKGTGLTALLAVCPVLSVFAFGTPAQSLPDSPGKDVFESVCNLCHDAPAAVMGKQWTKAQWEAKVAEMLQEETDVTTEERAAIVEYLSANFKPGGKIYVNKSTAKDLEAALEVSAAGAEAIARYREEHGPFKTVDDLENVLKSVAGDSADRADRSDDAAKIEARKDRLAF
jgi:competence ComEA-like helix-hairpin-helix protein